MSSIFTVQIFKGALVNGSAYDHQVDIGDVLPGSEEFISLVSACLRDACDRDPELTPQIASIRVVYQLDLEEPLIERINHHAREAIFDKESRGSV